MPVRSIAQLKEWFRKGCYPKEEHFADLIDSYFHKEEGVINISRIDELGDRLNGKYPATSGTELERRFGVLSADFDTYRNETDIQLDNIASDIEELDERQQGEIDTLITRLDEARADIDDEITRSVAADAEITEALAGKADDDDPRLSDAREAAGGFADSIANRRDASEHYGIWVGTQEEYDAIESKDSTTIYYTL